jgi:hypothetical protein
MHAGDIRPGDTNLKDALETMRATPGEARKFASDPEGYLKSKGVVTDGLRIGMSQGELTDEALDAVAGGGLGPLTICGSVGVVICASVGE